MSSRSSLRSVTKSTGRRSGRVSKRLLLWAGLSLLLCGLLVLLAPAIIARTSLRSTFLERVIAAPGLDIEVAQAELGWTSPVKLKRLSLRWPDQQLQLTAEQLLLEKPWPQLWRSAPHLGHVEIQQPEVELVIQHLIRRERDPSYQELEPLSLTASITDAKVRIQSEGLADPLIELDDMDLDFAIETQASQSVLTLGRTRFMDHYPLHPDLCREGLQVVAPILAEAADVEGTVSLELASLNLPLNGSNELTEVHGTLQLHDVATGIKNPVLQETLTNLATLFDFEMPQSIELAREATIPFSVRDDRVWHEDIEFLIPTLTGERTWRSEGSVGLDESLDLTVWAPIPVDGVADSAVARLLSDKPLKLHVGGTIQEPKIDLPEDSSFTDQLGDVFLGSEEEELDVDHFLDRVEAVLETGEAAAPIWNWGYEWLDGS